jgi:hypothetical protein
MPPYGPALSRYGVAYDTSKTEVKNQLQAAVTARQTLANDIYRRLLAITGTQPPRPPPAPPAPPPATFAPALAPCRWLAQLAVNIVDYIDDDDMNTPFNFYNTTDGLPAAQIGTTVGTNDDSTAQQPGAMPPQLNTGLNPVYWVFGTELPKVVLNEVLAETNHSAHAADVTRLPVIKVWVELYNTMQLNSNATPYPQNVQLRDSYRVPFYMNAPPGNTTTVLS